MCLRVQRLHQQCHHVHSGELFPGESAPGISVCVTFTCTITPIGGHTHICRHSSIYATTTTTLRDWRMPGSSLCHGSDNKHLFVPLLTSVAITPSHAHHPFHWTKQAIIWTELGPIRVIIDHDLLVVLTQARWVGPVPEHHASARIGAPTTHT